MIKKIVLAIDLGVDTSYLLQYAASLSNQYRASLIVVHAIEPIGTLGYSLLQTYLKPERPPYYPSGGGTMDPLIEKLRSQVIDILTDEYMSGAIKLPLLEGVIVRAGEPIDIIQEVVEEVDADILVLGNRAHDISEGQISNVTQKLANNSRIPVYMIPCPNKAPHWNYTAPDNINPSAPH